MFLRDIGTERDTRKEWHLVPPSGPAPPGRRPPPASRVVGWLIILIALPLGLAGVMLLIPFLAAVALGARMNGIDF